MRQRIVYINLMFLAALALLAVQHISAWEGFERDHELSEMVRTAMGPAPPARSLGLENVDATRPISEFMSIAEKNLFSQDRASSQSAEESSTTTDEPPPKWAARPILHGISSVGGERQAVMTVFEGNQRNRKFRTVRVGAQVQGFEVEEIAESSVKLRWNDRQEIIDLGDPSEVQASAPKTAQASQAAVTVITVGTAARGGRAGAGRAARTAAQPQQEERGVDVAVVAGRAAAAAAPGQAQAPARGGQLQGQRNQRRPGTVGAGAQSPAATRARTRR